ncbi:putative succinyl-CoA:3-ketoacid coenzyme A transferase, mitochondrial [Frankliniella fusca]|uniref:Succinyl-CoA:3-ketoacid coenzyme A transferase, mitochondrial n=1 Tax=Frankliniella fusca TaxID=407009 RepID=A0AAE1H748_9NEOP|nr:putative succinyl-CoA:3-ketoacid coenzyme A transferase, mitochondrial [Frankliniella fusca]
MNELSAWTVRTISHQPSACFDWSLVLAWPFLWRQDKNMRNPYCLEESLHGRAFIVTGSVSEERGNLNLRLSTRYLLSCGVQSPARIVGSDFSL